MAISRARAAIRVAVVLVTTALLASHSSGCQEPTQITVEITTDVPCGDMRATTITVGDLTGIDQRPITAQTSTCNGARIGSLVVTPSAANNDVVAIRVVSSVKKDIGACGTPGTPGCIVARRALRYVPHKPLFLPILMASSCDGVVCKETETCVKGECRSATINDPDACAVQGACAETVLVSASGTVGPPTTPTTTPTTPTSKRRALTINNTGIGRLVDFPVLVALDPTRINYASAKPDGADIRFTDGAGTDLAYEIERWDPTPAAGRSILWVRVPVIEANGPTVFFLNYGNPAATPGERATQVWDSNYVGVYHLAKDIDSTGKHAALNKGGVRSQGALGDYMTFNGNVPGSYFDTGAADNLEMWTMDVWFRAADVPNTTIGDSGPLSRGFNYEIQWNCNGARYCRSVNFNLADGSNTNLLAYYGDPPPNTWTHLAATYDKKVLNTYLAGESKSAAFPLPGGATFAAAGEDGPALLGKRINFEGYYKGDVDEARISNIARSADYVKANHKSSSDTYITYGPEQNQ